MTFLSTLALAVGLLVVAPYLAHRLRRRYAEEQPFAAARLVPPAPPHSRRRSRLEDRALLATRVVSVLALALLGATPFVRCSRLSLERTGGASIAMALVVDDSMSMRALAGGRSRFERARQGAREILASAREGDAVAIVLAGSPVRVELAATTDLETARQAVDALLPSDRGTDLDGALAVAQNLVSSRPQVDHRVVLLSDLADGRPGAAALGGASAAPVWVAIPEIEGDLGDCGIMRADQVGARVRVSIACGPGHVPAGRNVVAEDANGKTLGAPVPVGADGEAVVAMPSNDARADRVRLTGADAVASDDAAPVVPEVGRNAVAIVVDAADEAVATGGAPIVEQALGALKLDIDAVPLPAVPDRVEDLGGDLGILLDDPPGLTPEQRHALAAFIDGGGVVLLALGPHAASAPLGATLEPILSRATSWADTAVRGARTSTATGGLAESATSLADLAAPRRSVLAAEDVASFDSLVQWGDGQPLVARRIIGLGEVWVVTLPFSVDSSDFPLRPAFLSLLDAWASRARQRAAPPRSLVGEAWRYPAAGHVEAIGPLGSLAATYADGVARLVPSVIGAYRVTYAGKAQTRVAAPDPRELDLRPRRVASGPYVDDQRGERRAAVDVSGAVALFLLALVALEMGLRIAHRRRAEAA